MHRIENAERPGWKAEAARLGYDYHGADTGESCWNESAHYVLDGADVEALENATAELHARCMDLVGHVCSRHALMERFGIPAHMRDYVSSSWTCLDKNPHLLGRFDFAFAPDTRSVKMIEYNADTPTTAIETAVIQWQWLQATHPGRDQFNSLHEALIHRLGDLRTSGRLRTGRFAMAPYPDSLEDLRHCEYYVELAAQAGIEADIVNLADIGVTASGRFVDGKDRPIDTLLKIYPWEMLSRDRYSHALGAGTLQMLEPPWKMILSNKAILPTLWEMFPDHPNLLRSAWSPDGMGSYVAKPIFSRGGENVEVVLEGNVEARTEGTYGGYPVVYQEYVDLPRFGDRQAQIGSWVVGDEPAGIIVREAPAGGIVVDRSTCVPHIID